MKVLVLGNSQAGALKRAHDENSARLADADIEISFFVIPGGMGPDLTVENDHLSIGKISVDFPPYGAPAGVEKAPLSSFDAILLSALGYVDGGYAYKNPITTCAALSQFEPRGPGLRQPLVSDRCMADMVAAMLERQPGIGALRSLRAAGLPILVQPWPEVSEDMLRQPDWGLRAWYTRPLDAYRFFASTRDNTLDTICQESGAEMLPRPIFGTATGLTPADFMREIDGVHQADRYGAITLDILKARLTDGADAAKAMATQRSGVV